MKRSVIESKDPQALARSYYVKALLIACSLALLVGSVWYNNAMSGSVWWAIIAAIRAIIAAFNGTRSIDWLSGFVELDLDLLVFSLLALLVLLPCVLLVCSPGIMIVNIWRGWRSTRR